MCEREKIASKRSNNKNTQNNPPKKEASVYEGWFRLLAHSLIFSEASLWVSKPPRRRYTGNYSTVMETTLNRGENDPS